MGNEAPRLRFSGRHHFSKSVDVSISFIIFIIKTGQIIAHVFSERSINNFHCFFCVKTGLNRSDFFGESLFPWPVCSSAFFFKTWRTEKNSSSVIPTFSSHNNDPNALKNTWSFKFGNSNDVSTRHLKPLKLVTRDSSLSYGDETSWATPDVDCNATHQTRWRWAALLLLWYRLFFVI